jgi:FG-GAP repeat.
MAAKSRGVKGSSTELDDVTSFTDLGDASPSFTGLAGGSPSDAPASALPPNLADASPWHDTLLLQNLQQLATWVLNGTSVIGGGGLSPKLGDGWAVLGTGDFEGTGSKDILLRNGNGGQLAVWQTSGQSVVGGGALSASLQPGWSYVAVGDLNGDKKSDLVLQKGQDLAVWFMNGTTVTSGANIGTLGAGWSVAGTGDFNGDGKDDLLLQKGVPNADPLRFQVQLAVWEMDGQSVVNTSGLIGNLGENWFVAGIGDFNKDNHADLLLQRGPELAEWQMNGTKVIGGGTIGQLVDQKDHTPWIVNGVGDYNNDGYSDILLQNSDRVRPQRDVQLAEWQLNGTTILPTSGNLPALSPGYTVAMPPPTVPIQFVNVGGLPNDQIYITIIGAFPVTSGRTFINGSGETVGRGAWVDFTGQAREPDAADVNAPNHLTKDGKNYANYSFTLSQLNNSQLNIPALIGVRVYVSLGVPLYVTADEHHIIGTPDAANPNNNPNYLTHFDHYEETFDPTTHTTYGANVTMIDQFGLPLTHRLEQTRTNYDTTRGMINPAKSLADMTADYINQTPTPFHDLIKYESDNKTVLRIIPPRADLLPASMQHYLDPAIDAFWNYYASHDFSVQYDLSHLVKGRVNDRGQFAYQTITNNGTPKSFTMAKPTSSNIFANDGVFAPPGADGDQGAFLAQFAGAFNRGVASSPSDWTNPDKFYKSSTVFNNYAAFFHQQSVDGKAYAFGYDDTQNQSSVTILNNDFSPTKVTLDIGH